jgi:hypothetical protein
LLPPSFLSKKKLGCQTWAAKDLNVTIYRNGDPIMKAESSSEWRKAAMNKIGAYCITNQTTVTISLLLFIITIPQP